MEYKLGNLSNFYDSLHKTPKVYSTSGYPMIRVKDIETGFLNISQTANVSEVDYLEFTKKYKPTVGDIIITRVGTYGNVALVVKDENFCLGQNTVVLNPIRKTIDNKYLFYALRDPYVQQQIESKVTGSTQKTISLKSLKEIEVKRFDYKKEILIGKFLYNIDNKIEINKKIIANLEELSQTLFKHWFVDFEFPDKDGNPYKSSGGEMVDSELGEIPKNWRKTTLGNYIDLDKAGDIIIAATDLTQDRKMLGAPALVPNLNKNMIYSLDVFKVKESTLPKYVAYFLMQTNKYREFVEGSATGTTVLRVSKDIILKVPITIDLNIAKEFNEIIKKYMHKIEKLNKENEILVDLRDTLLPKLMSGELEIPDDVEVNTDELSI